MNCESFPLQFFCIFTENIKMSELLRYNFSLDQEPSDEQLHQLMKEVAEEAKKRAIESDKLFYEQLNIIVNQTLIKNADNLLLKSL
jgi:hypothetical protein